jgi:hypothetical protein
MASGTSLPTGFTGSRAQREQFDCQGGDPLLGEQIVRGEGAFTAGPARRRRPGCPAQPCAVEIEWGRTSAGSAPTSDQRSDAGTIVPMAACRTWGSGERDDHGEEPGPAWAEPQNKTLDAAEQKRPDVAQGSFDVPPGISRSDLGQHRHDAHTRPLCEGKPLSRASALRPLTYDQFCLRMAYLQSGVDLRARWPAQWQCLSPLGTTGTGSCAATGRSRGHGQSGLAQGRRHCFCHPRPLAHKCVTCHLTAQTTTRLNKSLRSYRRY